MFLQNLQCGGIAGTSPRCNAESPCYLPRLHNFHARRPAFAAHHHGTNDVSPSAALYGGSAAVARHQTICCAAAVDSAPNATCKIGDLSMSPIVNPQGYISIEVPEGTQASVFAIFDEKQKLQYVGFSKDLNNTLRTFFSRRPEKAFFYKSHNLQTLDQTAMIATRDGWFEDVGGAPPGNKLSLERNAWQNPMDCGARSDRGKEGASEERLREALEAIRARGCREDFVPDPQMYVQGKIEFLPAVAQTAEAIALAKATAAATARLSRRANATVDGEERPFSVFYRGKYATNVSMDGMTGGADESDRHQGGYMFDVDVTFEEAGSKHRVIVGKEYYEPYGIEPEAAVEAAMGLLFGQKEARQTEGILLSSQFPVNYFSMSGLEQWFGSTFTANFNKMTGTSFAEGNGDKYWRMNRLHDYAGKLDTAEQLDVSVGRH